MSEFQEKAHVVSRESITDDIFLLGFRSPSIATVAAPGQFLMVTCGSSNDPLLRRPFSIHAIEPAGIVKICFKVIGKGTKLLSELNVGETLDVIGPLGNGFSLQPDGPIVLLGGGLGIAPLFFLAEYLRRTRPILPADRVLLGARCADEVRHFCENFLQLGYVVQCATDDGSFGYHGFVTNMLGQPLENAKLVYACGPKPMMAVAAGKCAEASVRCEVSMETHMACGLGACLGCTIRGASGGYLHVCKRGPVMDAQEVEWNR